MGGNGRPKDVDEVRGSGASSARRSNGEIGTRAFSRRWVNGRCRPGTDRLAHLSQVRGDLLRDPLRHLERRREVAQAARPTRGRREVWRRHVRPLTRGGDPRAPGMPRGSVPAQQAAASGVDQADEKDRDEDADLDKGAQAEVRMADDERPREEMGRRRQRRRRERRNRRSGSGSALQPTPTGSTPDSGGELGRGRGPGRSSRRAVMPGGHEQDPTDHRRRRHSPRCRSWRSPAMVSPRNAYQGWLRRS